jgi:phage shock protein A
MLPLRRSPPDLTRAALVVTAPSRRGPALAALAAAAALGFGAALDPAVRWQHEAEQHRLALGVAEARAQELERQIDALNQRVGECRDELTFFRQARDGKR